MCWELTRLSHIARKRRDHIPLGILVFSFFPLFSQLFMEQCGGLSWLLRELLKVKSTIPHEECWLGAGAHLTYFIQPWVRRCINHWSLWRMAIATSGYLHSRGHPCFMTGIKLYCSVTDAHVCEQRSYHLLHISNSFHSATQRFHVGPKRRENSGKRWEPFRHLSVTFWSTCFLGNFGVGNVLFTAETMNFATETAILKVTNLKL